MIDEFKQAVKGVQRANRYKVMFSRTEFFNKFPRIDYHYLLKEINIPGETLVNASISLWGTERKHAAAMDYDPINMTFVCDSKMLIRESFEDWHNKIFDKKLKTVNYYDEYISDILIQVLNTANIVTRMYNIRESYPKTIGDLLIGYENNDSALEFSVTFDYLDWVKQDIPTAQQHNRSNQQ